MQVQDKIPRYGQFLKNPIHVVAYVLLLYFIYKEFTEENKCKQLETVVMEYKEMNTKLAERVETLEGYIDVKNGIIKKIESKLDSTSNTPK